MGTPTLWVCHFPNCITLPSGKCMFSLTQHHHLLQPATTLSLPLSRGHFHVRASQTNNARRIRRLKTDAEICSDIRQFVASVGLPEDHIPFTKELLDHGRKDLANIVRRRGHKQIRDLLKNSFYDDTDSLNTEKGQNEKADSLVGDDVTASTEFLQGDSSGSVFNDSTLSLDECTSIPVDSSTNSSVEDGLGEPKNHAEEVNNVAEESFRPTEATIVDNDCSSSRDLYPNFDSQSSMPTEISGESSFETMPSGNSVCEGTLVGKIIGDILLEVIIESAEDQH